MGIARAGRGSRGGRRNDRWWASSETRAGSVAMARGEAEAFGALVETVEGAVTSRDVMEHCRSCRSMSMRTSNVPSWLRAAVRELSSWVAAWEAGVGEKERQEDVVVLVEFLETGGEGVGGGRHDVLFLWRARG